MIVPFRHDDQTAWKECLPRVFRGRHGFVRGLTRRGVPATCDDILPVDGDFEMKIRLVVSVHPRGGFECARAQQRPGRLGEAQLWPRFGTGVLEKKSPEAHEYHGAAQDESLQVGHRRASAGNSQRRRATPCQNCTNETNVLLKNRGSNDRRMFLSCMEQQQEQYK